MGCTDSLAKIPLPIPIDGQIERTQISKQFTAIQQKVCANSPNSKFPKFQNFVWDPQTKYAERFTIQSKKVTALNVGLPYQLACPNPITNSCHVVYRIIKNVNSMGFGLMSDLRYYDQFIGKYIKGSPDGNKYTETILYSFNHTQQKGEIFCEGQQKIQKSPNLHIANGSFLMIEVDFENWQVTFTNEKTKESFNLPESFRETNFYFNGFITQNGDSFEVIN